MSKRIYLFSLCFINLIFILHYFFILFFFGFYLIYILLFSFSLCLSHLRNGLENDITFIRSIFYYFRLSNSTTSTCTLLLLIVFLFLLLIGVLTFSSLSSHIFCIATSWPELRSMGRRERHRANDFPTRRNSTTNLSCHTILHLIPSPFHPPLHPHLRLLVLAW